jgi:hypothetical protein
VKALYALVFVLFSFAATAQPLETWIPPYYLEDVDCFGEMNQQGTMPSQIIGMDQFCAVMLSDADGVAITTPSKDEEDIPVGAVQPSQQNSTVKFSAASDDELAMDDTIEQSAMPTQIAVSKPTIETLSEAKPDEADGAAITGHVDAEDIPVGAVQPSQQNSTVKFSAASDDELAMDDTIEQSAMPTQIAVTKPRIEYGEAKIIEADDVTITGPNYSKDVEVGGIEARDGNPIAAYSGQSDDQSTVDGTID